MANGSTKHGDALRDKLAEDFMKSQAERRAALKALRDSDWEVDSTVTVNAEPGAIIHVGNTGKHQAVKPSDPPSSSLVPKGAKGISLLVRAVNKPIHLGALIAILVFLAYLAKLKWG